VRLVVIDPLSAYLGGIDSHRNADVRGLLAPVQAFAEEHDCCVLAVTHLNKSRGTSALHRITGSGAFTAAARVVLFVMPDPDEPSGRRHLLLSGKNNVAPKPDGFAFSAVVRLRQRAPSLTWEETRVMTTPDDLLAAAEEPPDPERDAAADWLREELADGPVPAKKLKVAADDADHSWKAVGRARVALGIKPRTDGFQGPSIWRLPQ